MLLDDHRDRVAKTPVPQHHPEVDRPARLNSENEDGAMHKDRLALLKRDRDEPNEQQPYRATSVASGANNTPLISASGRLKSQNGDGAMHEDRVALLKRDWAEPDEQEPFDSRCEPVSTGANLTPLISTSGLSRFGRLSYADFEATPPQIPTLETEHEERRLKGQGRAVTAPGKLGMSTRNPNERADFINRGSVEDNVEATDTFFEKDASESRISMRRQRHTLRTSKTPPQQPVSDDSVIFLGQKERKVPVIEISSDEEDEHAVPPKETHDTRVHLTEEPQNQGAKSTALGVDPAYLQVLRMVRNKDGQAVRRRLAKRPRAVDFFHHYSSPSAQGAPKTSSSAFQARHDAMVADVAQDDKEVDKAEVLVRRGMSQNGQEASCQGAFAMLYVPNANF